MDEKKITEWMRNHVKQAGFRDAASLAKEFLTEHEISSSQHPDFNKVIQAGFTVALEN